MLTVESTMDAAGLMEPALLLLLLLLLQMSPTALVSTLQLTTSMEQLIGAPGKPTNLGV